MDKKKLMLLVSSIIVLLIILIVLIFNLFIPKSTEIDTGKEKEKESGEVKEYDEDIELLEITGNKPMSEEYTKSIEDIEKANKAIEDKESKKE